MISFISKNLRSDGNGSINSVFLMILWYLSVILLLSITVVLVLKKGSRKRRSNLTGAKTRQRNITKYEMRKQMEGFISPVYTTNQFGSKWFRNQLNCVHT